MPNMVVLNGLTPFLPYTNECDSSHVLFYGPELLVHSHFCLAVIRDLKVEFIFYLLLKHG
jgi:hypothetical protein